MKVVVLGNTGMLGHMVQAFLHKGPTFEVLGLGRDIIDVRPGAAFLEAKLHRYIGNDTDYVINCIGAIKPTFKPGREAEGIFTNAVFPWILSDSCAMLGARLLHITTDCVFKGTSCFYTETSAHDAIDLYGQSKSLGEPTNCMNVRTSIIGPEIRGRNTSFFQWVLSQRGKTLNGFTNHKWNGLTTLELARCLRDIMVNDLYVVGTRHVFGEDICKFMMVKRVMEVFQVEGELKLVQAPEEIDRTLRSKYELNAQLAPKSFDGMLADLREWMLDSLDYKVLRA